ncbi:hypothetical protein IZY60_14335 [Lutibacter sp. B2]|nr:hypothetical protein [Lutibacter sp. B2]
MKLNNENSFNISDSELIITDMKEDQLISENMNHKFVDVDLSQEISEENFIGVEAVEEIEVRSMHAEEISDQQTEITTRQSRSRGRGIEVESIVATGKNIKKTLAGIPIFIIKQSAPIQIKLKNHSSQNKTAKVLLSINGRVIQQGLGSYDGGGNLPGYIPAGGTRTISLDMSLTGPGIHTIKVAAADLGGSSYHDKSSKFYWAAMEGKAVKFTLTPPSRDYNKVRKAAPYKLEIFNVGTVDITTLKLAGYEDKHCVILQNLGLPKAIPPGGTLSFTANYIVKTPGKHTVKFEVDPSGKEFDRTALMNALGENLIETDTREWKAATVNDVVSKLRNSLSENMIADLINAYRQGGKDSTVVQNTMNGLLRVVTRFFRDSGFSSAKKGVIGIVLGSGGRYVVGLSHGYGYFRDGNGNDLTAQMYSLEVATDISAGLDIKIVVYPFWDSVDSVLGGAVAIGAGVGPASADITFGSWSNLAISIAAPTRVGDPLPVQAYITGGITLKEKSAKLSPTELDKLLTRLNNMNLGAL